MAELLTAAQMKALENAAIESGRVTGLELMERAGRGVVEAVFEECPELASAPHKAVVLSGPGNNGGDGFVVARLLKEWGWEVAVFLYGDPAKLPPDARANYERWCALGEVHGPLGAPLEQAKTVARSTLPEADVIFDALFGTGLTRPLGAIHSEIMQAFAQERGPNSRIVSVDMPSGLCSDSGRLLGAELEPRSFALKAALTVAFHAAKRGHYLGDGAHVCGKTVVKSIGLEGSASAPDERAYLVEAPTGALGKHAGHHKYSHGHALVLSGGAGRTGAARLAARGALRIGAGLVTLGVPASAQMEVASHVTALMLTRAGTGEELAAALEDERLNALCLGPALGLTRAKELVRVALAARRKTVLDADALSAFADAPEALLAQLHEGCVLTPHGGEFAKLFPDLAEKLNAPATNGPAYSKVDAARAAAARAGCTVLFKGAETVIAAPDGRCSVNAALYERSAPWLATAGAGDVLAGFIAGLLARGFAPMQAAETAALLHVECARSFGAGLIAEDLPEELPKVLKKLEF